jgi:hypothetical protein
MPISACSRISHGIAGVSAQIQAAGRGCTLNDPLLKLEFSYACAEFPLLRMSEEGLFRTDTKEHLSVVA